MMCLQKAFSDYRRYKGPKALMEIFPERSILVQKRREADGAAIENYIAVDGIENVIKILEEIEDDKVPVLTLLNCRLVSGGCVGGVLNVVNSYVAKKSYKEYIKNFTQQTMAKQKI